MINIYDTLYTLVNNTIFGGSIAIGSYPDMIATVIATLGVCFIIAVPFMVLWKVIKLIVGG